MSNAPQSYLSEAAQDVAKKLNLALNLMDSKAAVEVIKASPEAARELLSQKPEESTACRNGMSRLMGTSGGRGTKEAQRLAAPRRALINFLELNGWRLPKKVEQDMAIDAWRAPDAKGLEWGAQRGIFTAEFEGAALKSDEPVLRAFLRQRPQDLKSLSVMIRLGAFKDASGRVGWTDFASCGLGECARLLGEHGFTPREQVVGPHGMRSTALKGMSAVCGVVCAALKNGIATPEKLGVCFETLAWLKKKGAIFSGPYALDPLKDPLSTAARMSLERGSDREVAEYFKLLQELLRLGADPNASGTFLSYETIKELKIRGAPRVGTNIKAHKFIGHAIEMGADPACHAGRALAVCMETPGITENVRIKIFESLIKAGCKVADMPKGNTLIVDALELQMFELAWCAIEHGSDPGWRGENGESVLGLLCARLPQDPKAGRDWVNKFMLQPKIAATLDEPGFGRRSAAFGWRSATREKDQKITALAWACAQGNLGAVEALIDAGADVNACGASGVRPLSRVGCIETLRDKTWGACQVAIVEKLLASGANPALLDAKGCAPVQELASSLNLDACAQLVRRHPHVFGSDRYGMAARQALIGRGEQGVAIVEMAELLVASSVQPVAPGTTVNRPRL